jgi:hypothetical protein
MFSKIFLKRVSLHHSVELKHFRPQHDLDFIPGYLLSFSGVAVYET